MKSYPEETSLLIEKIKMQIKEVHLIEYFKREAFEFLTPVNKLSYDKIIAQKFEKNEMFD